ncbi:hypothetical protein HanXRQr2_Chr09g0376251 [Helianthus annuus]|uniref:Uncharacterized protein n=1 Tax=Helianthus annuus TaxID=4232 RepID=A0A251TTD9_HELAN|nr:hypothetical protein HanXRQr2_Chr09g0376251 [Helianthus annuus]KAJ0892176.1 hypothetical protein HanPSC8_Chr09g0362801 [Helianthus annuus]
MYIERLHLFSLSHNTTDLKIKSGRYDCRISSFFRFNNHQFIGNQVCKDRWLRRRVPGCRW